MKTTKIGGNREKEQIKRSSKMVTAHDMDQEARDTATAAMARLEAHEELCTERWNTQALAMARIEATMKEVNDALQDKIGKAPAGLIAFLTAIIGFLAARVFPVH